MRTEIVVSADSWDSLNDYPLRMRTGLRFRSEGPGNDWTCFLEDFDSGRSYAMSQWQRWFLELIENRTPVQDAARLVIATFPDLVTREAIVRFVGWLKGEELLQKISTVKLKSREPDAEFEIDSITEKRLKLIRFRHQAGQFAMNAVAGLLIVVGSWFLKPSSQIHPGETRVALPAIDSDSATGISGASDSNLTVPVRANSAGILAEVFVRDGDEVEEGDLIARIDDPVVLHLLQDFKIQLGECRVRRDRYYLVSNQVDYLEETQRIANLSRQIGIYEAEATLAELRAPVGGYIETEVLCGQIGSEVARGDVLLKVHLEGENSLLAGNP